MKSFSEKVYLQLAMPIEGMPVSDEKRIHSALNSLGYSGVSFPLPVLQKLYPLCRDVGFDITVTLVQRENDWVITDVEAGDTRHHHYGLAVDYGSTTIIMQLVDLNSGFVVAEEKVVNGQTVYGSDILTRITYALDDAAHMDDLQSVTVQSFEHLLSALTESSGIDAAKCSVMIVLGNTTMVHFLLKLNAWTVFSSPYAPVVMALDSFGEGNWGWIFPGWCISFLLLPTISVVILSADC